MQHETEESKLLVTFRTQKFELSLRNDTTARDIKERIIIASGNGLSMSDIKLLFKGKAISNDDENMMQFIQSKSGAKKKLQKQYKIMATGRSSSEVQQMDDNFAQGMKNAPRIRDDLTQQGQKEALQRKRLGRRMLQDAAKKNNTGGGGGETSYGFGQINVLPNLPEQDKAREILTTLANDPGVLACMAKHKWNVGALSELMPDGKVGQSAVCVMGLNKNKGQEILLRIRTDDFKGFRKMLSIRKVLFHELAHNVHSEHDNQFFQLMRQIEKECNEMDWTNGTGLSSSQMDVDNGYDYTAGTHRLGGDDDWKNMTPRELAARAAMARLTAEEEEEIQNNCGCGRNDLFLPPSPKEHEEADDEKKKKTVTNRMDVD